MNNKLWCSLFASVLFIMILACGGLEETEETPPPETETPDCSGTECPASGQACGTRGADACPSGEVCIYEQSANCGRTDQPGTCQITPDICTREYEPVCGCDGKTYGNACEAIGAGASVDYEGKCITGDAHCDRDCTAVEYCPLAQGCSVPTQPTACLRRPEVCTQQYDPVCGCDGRTYGNACTAASHGVSIAYSGECPAAQ